MPQVYLKDGSTVEVSLENLGEFLHKNQHLTATRKKDVRRKPVN